MTCRFSKRGARDAIAWAVYGLVGLSMIFISQARAAEDPPRVEPDGAVHVPAFDLPQSTFLSEETRAALKQPRPFEDALATSKACPPIAGAGPADIAAIRQCQAEAFYQLPAYRKLRARYDVSVTPKVIGGVYTEAFTPTGGIARKNQHRVLINVHGGGFQFGSRTWSHLESVPIASVGQTRVISVDYRLWPPYRFPAATEDVVAVYRELLKSYKPKNIAIYGCSAGALVTAQTVARLQKDNLPLPAAVGLFCGAGSYYFEGDSGYLGAIVSWGQPLPRVAPTLDDPYFKGSDMNDPLVFPARSDRVLAKFPPSLLISSTRDQALSSVAYAHSRLVALGVEADLHVWEGLGHGFFMDADLPESREVYDVIVHFFDRHLAGRRHQPP